MKIWILKISTKNNKTITAYEDDICAFLALADYVECEWDKALRKQYGDFISLTKNDAVDLYFEQRAAAPDPEYYTIEEADFQVWEFWDDTEEKSLTEMGLLELIEYGSKKIGFAGNPPPGDQAIDHARTIFDELLKRLQPYGDLPERLELAGYECMPSENKSVVAIPLNIISNGRK